MLFLAVFSPCIAVNPFSCGSLFIVIVTIRVVVVILVAAFAPVVVLGAEFKKASQSLLPSYCSSSFFLFLVLLLLLLCCGCGRSWWWSYYCCCCYFESLGNTTLFFVSAIETVVTRLQTSQSYAPMRMHLVAEASWTFKQLFHPVGPTASGIEKVAEFARVTSSVP